MVEKSEAYMLPNHSCFVAMGSYFLEVTRILPTLSKVSSSFVPGELHRDRRHFLEEFVSTILSTTTTRSLVCQDMSCFCPKKVTGEADYSAFYLFGQLLYWLFELFWVRWSKMEAAKAESHSFIRQQRQAEESASRSRAPSNSVLAFCNQSGFRSRCNM